MKGYTFGTSGRKFYAGIIGILVFLRAKVFGFLAVLGFLQGIVGADGA